MDEKILKRQSKLMEPIHRQIMMTDDKNDLLILATNMLTTSMNIFYQHYGHDGASGLIDTIADGIKNKYNTTKH
jgi:hypothetical protein